jgi:hypothetical protein
MRFAVFDSPFLIWIASHRYDCHWPAGLLGLSCLDFSIPPRWVVASGYRRGCNLRLAAAFSSMRMRFAVFDSPLLIGLATHRYDCDWSAGLLGLSCLDFSIPPAWVAASDYRRDCNLRLAAVFSSMRVRFAVFDSTFLIGLASHRYGTKRVSSGVRGSGGFLKFGSRTLFSPHWPSLDLARLNRLRKNPVSYQGTTLVGP